MTEGKSAQQLWREKWQRENGKGGDQNNAPDTATIAGISGEHNATAAGLTAGGGKNGTAPAGSETEAIRTEAKGKEENHQQHSNGGGPAQASKLAYALAYARYGMRVFPCHEIELDLECSCGKIGCSSAAKHPRIKDWQILATCDETEIRNWWAEWPNANIGVACGQSSNLTVLDVDGEEGRATLRDLELEHGELPETPMALTGSDGVHYYFAHAAGPNNAVRWAPGLDVRTDGGLVVGVGSRNRHGAYRWEAAFTLGSDGLLPAKMPGWLLDAIKAGQKNQAPQNGKVMLPARPLAEGEGRNNTLYRLGRSLKAQGLPQAAIEYSLGASNATFAKPLDSRELAAVVQQVLTQGDRPEFGVKPATIEPEIVLPDLTKKTIEPLNWRQMRERRAAKTREWIVSGKLARGEISSWSGKVEAGKTTLMRELTLCVLRGDPFLGCDTQQGRVAYVMLDADGEDVTFDAFQEMGFCEDDADNCLFLFEPTLAQIERGFEKFIKILMDFNPTLVIVDPYPRLKMIEDFHSYTNTYLMAELSQVAQMVNAHFALPGHVPRGRDDDADVATAGFGSISFSGGVNARFIVTNRNGKHTIRSSQGKGAGFQPFEGEQSLVQDEFTKRISIGGAWSWKDKARSYMPQVLEFLDDHQDRPFSVVTLAKELRVQKSVVRAAANMLFNEQKINRGGEGIRSDPYIFASFGYSGEMTQEAAKYAEM